VLGVTAVGRSVYSCFRTGHLMAIARANAILGTLGELEIPAGFFWMN